MSDPWRIMTPEEYAELRIIGPHLVEKDHDGAGGVAVWLTPLSLADELTSLRARVLVLEGAIERALEGVISLEDAQGSCWGFKLADVGAGSYQDLEVALQGLSQDQGREGYGSSRAESGGMALPKSDGLNSTGKWRKRPVVIDAYRFENKVGVDTRPAWIITAEKERTLIFINARNGPPHLTIGTLEGDMRADIGDWIIKGVKGEIYPCKPDIFAMTYEPACPAENGASSPTEGRAGNLAGDEPTSSSPPQATNSEVEGLTDERIAALSAQIVDARVHYNWAYSRKGAIAVVRQTLKALRAALAQQDPNP